MWPCSPHAKSYIDLDLHDLIFFIFENSEIYINEEVKLTESTECTIESYWLYMYVQIHVDR